MHRALISRARAYTFGLMRIIMNHQRNAISSCNVMQRYTTGLHSEDVHFDVLVTTGTVLNDNNECNSSLKVSH